MKWPRGPQFWTLPRTVHPVITCYKYSLYATIWGTLTQNTECSSFILYVFSQQQTYTCFDANKKYCLSDHATVKSGTHRTAVAGMAKLWRRLCRTQDTTYRRLAEIVSSSLRLHYHCCSQMPRYAISELWDSNPMQNTWPCSLSIKSYAQANHYISISNHTHFALFPKL